MTGGLASAALTAEQQAVYDAVMAKLEERGGNHYVSITTSKDEKQGNYDNKGATGSDSIAIGGKAVTPSNGSIALGSGAVAGDVNKLPKDNAGRMISIGNESHANNQNTIALGNYSKAYGFMGIAIGTEALTTNDKRPGYNYTDGIAVGNYSISDGTSALAIGERSIAQASNAVSIGKRTYASEDSFAGGNAAIAQSNSIALGHGAVVYQEKKYWDDNKAGMDQMINATKGADAEYIYGGGDNKGWFAYKKMATPNFSAIAVGAYSQVTDIRGTAIGYAANAASKDALAMGTHATVTKEAERGVALGTFSVASRKGDALGYNPVSGKAFENEAEVAAYLGKADEYKVLAEKIKTQQEDYKAKQAAYEADKGNADKRKAANEAKTELSKSVSEKYTMLGAFLSRPGAVSVGDSDFTRQITNVAAGSEDTDAVNVAQLKALNKKVEGNKIHYLSIGPDNEKNLAKDGNYNNDGADSHWGIAIGVNASSKGSGSIAIGKGSQAHGTNKYRAQGVSIGSASRAIGAFATAVGHDTKASGEYSSAYGMGEAYGRGSMAIGWGAIAALKPGITKEEYNKLSDEEKAWYGKADYADQKTFYQFRHKGKDGKVEDIKNYGMAIGAGANSFDNAGLAVGFNAKTNKDFGVALGGYSVNKVEQGVALGTSSVADREKDVKGYLPTTGKVVENFEEAMKAAGKEEAFKELKAKYLAAQENLTKAQEAYKADQSPTNMMNLDKAQKELKGLTEEYAVMTAPWTSRKGAVSVGNDKTGFTRQITGVAAGSEDTDAVNVAQLKAVNNKVDKGAIHYVSVTPVKKDETADSNYLNDGAKGDGGIAIGQNATSQGRGIAMGYKSSATPKEGTKQILHNSFEGIAIGQEAHMEVPGGIAIGLRSKVEGTLNTKDGNVNEQGTVALGTDSHAKGNGAAAFGWKAKGIGEGAMAFGTNTEAKESGTAFGGNANAAAGAVAMGWQANAHDVWAMSIGTSSDAKGKFSTALGGATTAEAVGSTAVGFKAVSKEVLSTAVGAQSVAEESGSVALGADSVANTKAGEIGYIATGGSATFEDALKTLNKKEDYDKWTATVNASKTEYDNLTQAFNDASKDKKDEAKAALDEWKGQHADFIEALTKKEKLEATWRATKAAVSVGADGVDKAGNRIIESRQITNVAAGTQDTDAVNVAQLKALNTKVDQGTIHYYSVTSDKKAAGSNFDNDGAKAADSMVIGISSSSEAPNSTVLGNNNTLKRYNADQNGSSSRNNIVVGQNMDVEGAHNAVFGTDYQNNRENRKTMVAGKYNTVIGVGNLAGYTAEKDPQDRSKWIYSKVQNGSDSGNVVVGMNNTATRGSIVIGADSEASSHGTSVGSNNKVIGNGDKGLALGNSLTVDGEQAVAIGSDSQAKADYAVAVGQEAIAEKESSIAFGDAAKAQNKYSVAFGSFAKATARSGVAIGSSSLADREKGAIGYLAGEETSEVWKATQGAVSVGNKEKKYTRQITGVAAGTEDTDAVNVAQLKALNTKVDKGAIHYFSVKSDDSANPAGTNWNNDGATGQDAVAIGKNAAASGKSAFATGWKSKAAGYSDIAIGREAEATGGWGVAIGQSAKAQASTAVAMAYAAEAKGSNSLAIGVQSEAKTNDSTAYGREAKALGDVALAVGAKTKAEGNHSSVFGYEATTDSTAWNGTAIGRGAYIGKQAADGTTPDVGVSNNYYTPVDDDTAVEAGKETMNSTAVGFGAKSFGYQNTALGAGAEAFDTNTVAVGVMSKAIGHYANAFGKQARAEGTNSTAIGHFARALGESSMALGDYAITSTLDGKGKVNRSVALGSHARVAADNSLALGYNSLANIADDVDTEAYLSKEAFKKENGVVSVGNSEYTIGDETIAQNYRRITNVAGGAADNDAVNVAQLKVVNKKADQNATDITNLKNTVNANGKATKVTVDGEENSQDGNLKIKKTDTDGQLTYDLSLNDEITIGKDGKDGKIGINGKDGISADITVGKGEAGVDGKDGITRIIYKDEKGNHHEVATLDDGLKFKGDAGDVVIRKLNTQLDIKGGAKAEDLSDDNIGVVGTAGDNGGMAVKLSKKLKGLTSAEFVDGDNITNISAGNVTITRKDGKVDLWELNKTVNNITQGTTDVSSWKLQANGANERTIKKDSIVNFKNGQNTEVTVNGNDITVDLNAATKKQINDNTTNITNMKKDIKDIQTTVNNIDTKIEQKIEGSKIKVEGDAKTGVKAEAVKTGDKVTGYKVSLDKKVQVGNVTIDGTTDGVNKKGEITGLTNTTVDAADFATKGRAATEEQLKAAMGKVQAQSRTTVKGSNNITVTPKTPNAAEYTVELAKDISVNSVTANEYKVGGTTYINKDGINANGKKITNVADGVVSKDSKDAVNGSQLFATNQQVVSNMNQINSLRDESREGDALGAAMAALKPIDFDPYQRSQVMAGVGYYRGKEAVALGLAHYKNEDLMFHGGLAYAGNSELMANIGVTYRFGSKDDRDIKHERNLRMPQYAEGPISSVYMLQDEVDRLTKENKEANDRIAALEAKLEKVLEKVK